MSQAAAKSPESEAPKAAAPIGRTTTTDERPTWEIDGKLYELRRIGDFGIAGQQRLNRDGREFYQLWTADEELNDDQGKRLKFLIDRMFDGDDKVEPLLVGVAKSVLKKLHDGDKADVVLTFTLAPLQKAIAAAQTPQTETEQDTVEARDGSSTTTT